MGVGRWVGGSEVGGVWGDMSGVLLGVIFSMVLDQRERRDHISGTPHVRLSSVSLEVLHESPPHLIPLVLLYVMVPMLCLCTCLLVSFPYFSSFFSLILLC